MISTFIYHTEEYHKLVESVARVCYQSYGKVSDTSHTMLKGIMSKGHLSVASVGNMVFGFNYQSENDLIRVLADLTTFHEINPFVRWTFKSEQNHNSKFDVVVSMNILSLLDINREYEKMYDGDKQFSILNTIMSYVKEVPYLYWFFDDATEVPPVENPYFAEPTLEAPVVLSQDYTALEGVLTPYELDIHATVTVDFVCDRAIGLQMWRHGAYTGGCELSQRYVDRGSATFTVPKELQENPNMLNFYEYMMKDHIRTYTEFQDRAREELGVGAMRAKEIARNLLPNVHTRILQCRPMRQWKHLIHLRDTPHAQPENRAVTVAIKNAMIEAGVVLESASA